MVQCRACGTENPPGAGFCSQCARKLDADTQAKVVRQREEHTATGIDWSRVIIALVVAIIIVVAIALLVTHTL